MSDLATAALIRKRAELAGEIEARATALDQLRVDLAHLDAAIRIMCPDAEPELIRPRSPAARAAIGLGDRSCRGSCWSGLRAAEQPLSCVEIARAVMARKGLDAADRTALQRIVGMVKGALHRRHGRMVERVGNGPRDVRWRINEAL